MVGPARGCAGETLVRNNTSFPVKAAARLRDLHAEYQRLAAEGAAAVAAAAPGDSPDSAASDASSDAMVAAALKYYQFLVRAVLTDPEFGIGECGNARGLLVYHTMGMGKTFLAVAAAMALWDVRAPVILAPKSLQKNFRETIERFVALIHRDERLAPAELAARQAAAVRRFRFVSLDAYNMATQIAKATSGVEGAGTLTGRFLIIDEAHNFFRAIINSSSEKTNARRLYEMIMEADNLRLLFLTGTPVSKDPFELVPCFNMLAGYDLLPTQYEVFYKHYVDRAARRLANRDKLANRLVGLVSHVTHNLPTGPADRGGPRAAREKGGFPEELPTIVERVEMSPEQYRQYLLAREKEEAEGRGGAGFAPNPDRIVNSPALSLPGAESEAASTYYVRSRSLSNFAPPREYKDLAVADMPPDAFTPETSPKDSRLVANIAKSPGPALVYSQFVDVGGLAPVARFLENAGYTRYEVPKAGAAEDVPAGAAEGAPCLSSASLMAYVREMTDWCETEPSDCQFEGSAEPADEVGGLPDDAPDVPPSADAPGPASRAAPKLRLPPPGLRYAVISGEVPPEDRIRIQEVFNSLENTHGELIKVLLISKTGAEGLDLKGLRQTHTLEPYWYKSREDQVKFRGIRLGSHDHVPPEEREVQPFLYLAVANREMFEGMQPTAREAEAPPRRYKLIETQTIDERFHERGLAKQALTLDAQALLREVCLECANNGYGRCRLCVPTDAPLFHEDPVRDLRLPDPCRPLAEAEVAVEEIALPGDAAAYYYRRDPEAPLGIRFFEYDPELEAYSPVDPSSGLYMRLYEALAER